GRAAARSGAAGPARPRPATAALRARRPGRAPAAPGRGPPAGRPSATGPAGSAARAGAAPPAGSAWGISTTYTARRTPAWRGRARSPRPRTPSSAPRAPAATPPRHDWPAGRRRPSRPRVDRADRGVAVLVRRATGHVVAAVRVRARLARRPVAVLGAYQAFVGRSGRRLRVPAGGHLLPQHRHHLPAEQLQLLQHLRQGQPGVVDEEELALVVAEVLPEGQGLVDDLLRAADRQRGLGDEVFERRAVPVHRRLVEVRAELPPRVLGTLRDVRLAAQSHARLIISAVAVVGEALPVEPDQAHEVLLRPEDVVGEEPVAVVRRLLGDLRRTDGPVPHERRDVVQRPWGRGEALQRGAELALPVDHGLAPQPVQPVVVLQRPREPLADVLAEPRVDRRGVAAAQHQVHPSLGQVLQQGVLLGDAHRVVGGDQRGGGGEDQPAGGGRDVRQQRRGRGGEERRVVVLPDREDVEPDLLRLLRDVDDRVDPLRFARRVAGDRVPGDVAHRKDTELHTVSFPTWGLPRLHAFACNLNQAGCITIPGAADRLPDGSNDRTPRDPPAPHR